MSKVLTEMFGAGNLPALEKLASAYVQQSQSATPTIDALAEQRAVEMLKIAAEVVEAEQGGAPAAEDAGGEPTDEEVLDDAVTLRALEKLAAENYDPELVIAAIRRAAGQ